MTEEYEKMLALLYHVTKGMEREIPEIKIFGFPLARIDDPEVLRLVILLHEKMSRLKLKRAREAARKEALNYKRILSFPTE